MDVLSCRTQCPSVFWSEQILSKVRLADACRMTE